MLTVEHLRRIVMPPVAVAVEADPSKRTPAEQTQLGRDAARAALASLRLDAGPLATGPHGPVWPDGVVGSIAHTAGTAIAIVARIDDRAALGIDIERSDRVLSARVLSRISTETERAWLHTAGVGMPLALFCSKEATYKALSRFDRHPISFVDVSFQPGAPDLLIGTLEAAARPFEDVSKVTARTLLAGGYVVALVEVGASLRPSSRADTEPVARDSR